MLIVDTREHEVAVTPILQAFTDMGMEWTRRKLDVGDYMFDDKPTLVIDRKQSLQEVCSNVCQQHRRFVAELDRAKENGIRLIILVAEQGVAHLEDVKAWKNPRRFFSKGALTGEKLYKIMSSIEVRHACEFRFCKPEQIPAEIIRILREEA